MTLWHCVGGSIVLAFAALVGCGGKTETGSAIGANTDGHTSTSALARPHHAASCGEVQARPGDDSCKADQPTCVGAAEYQCRLFDEAVDVERVSTQNDGTASLANSAIHFRASAHAQATQSFGSLAPGRVQFEARIWAEGTSNGVTVARIRLELESLEQYAADLRVVDGFMSLCLPDMDREVCFDIGAFGPRAWHRVTFAYAEEKLTASIDCNSAVTVEAHIPGALDPRSAVMVDFGIADTDCNAGVSVDFARAD